ncbi:hypothetical protein ABTY61_13430 [Kitasatospora sp. NPDC096128]|uniref:hypothetical protein n=1 Tax=Kitasatospora sp. NPDC096128 TaxID=3155547 RepID=UPI0033175C61
MFEFGDGDGDELGGAVGVMGLLTDAGVAFEAKELPRSKEADLQFVSLRSADSLDLALTYDSEVFSPERAEAYLVRLRAVVEAMAADRPVVEILEQEERTV